MEIKFTNIVNQDLKLIPFANNTFFCLKVHIAVKCLET